LILGFTLCRADGASFDVGYCNTQRTCCAFPMGYGHTAHERGWVIRLKKNATFIGSNHLNLIVCAEQSVALKKVIVCPMFLYDLYGMKIFYQSLIEPVLSPAIVFYGR
jgi:hypothetical protein